MAKIAGLESSVWETCASDATIAADQYATTLRCAVKEHGTQALTATVLEIRLAEAVAPNAGALAHIWLKCWMRDNMDIIREAGVDGKGGYSTND